MFERQPPISDAPSDAGFVQTICERTTGNRREPGQVVGRLVWHAPAARGTAQVLDLHVVESHRRGGCATRLIRDMLDQITRLNARRTNHASPIRVVWMLLAQKDHLAARAFLTRLGFHHVATSKHLYLDQDAMVYAKALD